MQHRCGVLGRHRVIYRHRVQHPPLRQRPRRAGRVQHRVEDPPRLLRGRQPGPHPHQHRVAEPPAVDVEAPAREPPAQIELESRDRLTIRQPEPALQHHHSSHHPRRHTAPPPRAEQIIEHRLSEQPAPLALQHREHRLRRQPLTHERGPLEQISLTRLHTHRHGTNLPARPNNIHAILPKPTGPKPSEKHRPPRPLPRFRWSCPPDTSYIAGRGAVVQHPVEVGATAVAVREAATAMRTGIQPFVGYELRTLKRGATP